MAPSEPALDTHARGGAPILRRWRRIRDLCSHPELCLSAAAEPLRSDKVRSVATAQADTVARRAVASRSRHEVPDNSAPLMIRATIAAAQVV